VPGGLGQGLGPQAERVDFLTGEPAALRDALGRDILARHIDVPGSRPGRARVSPGRGAQRHPAHRLDPARDPDADRVRRDEPGHQVRRLLRRTALRVQRQAAGRMRQPGVQPGRPGDVVRLLARLRDATACYLLYLGRRDPRPVDQRRLRGAQDLGRVHARQHAAALSDRGPYRLDDHRGPHGPPPPSVV